MPDDRTTSFKPREGGPDRRPPPHLGARRLRALLRIPANFSQVGAGRRDRPSRSARRLAQKPLPSRRRRCPGWAPRLALVSAGKPADGVSPADTRRICLIPMETVQPTTVEGLWAVSYTHLRAHEA